MLLQLVPSSFVDYYLYFSYYGEGYSLGFALVFADFENRMTAIMIRLLSWSATPTDLLLRLLLLRTNNSRFLAVACAASLSLFSYCSSFSSCHDYRFLQNGDRADDYRSFLS